MHFRLIQASVQDLGQAVTRPHKIQLDQLGQKAGIMKKSWWKLIITDYPNFDPNDADLEHIAELIKQGYHQGELIQEEE